jgi:hypothetical protein
MERKKAGKVNTSQGFNSTEDLMEMEEINIQLLTLVELW